MPSPLTSTLDIKPIWPPQSASESATVEVALSFRPRGKRIDPFADLRLKEQVYSGTEQRARAMLWRAKRPMDRVVSCSQAWPPMFESWGF